MSRINPARRRAVRFAAAIEDSSVAASDARMVELVELVGALRGAPAPLARRDFVADLRAELMLAAETELTPTTNLRVPAQHPDRRRRDRRIAVALGGLAIVGATTTMAAASQTALPGDALYPLKRAIEHVDTTLATGDDHKGSELLDHAANRLDEVRELSRGSLDAQQTRSVESTLTTFSDQADQAADLLLDDYAETDSEQPITQLRAFINQSLSSLDRLETDLPESLRPSILQAAQVLVSIDQRVSDVCPECAGLAPTDLPIALTPAATGPASAPALQPLTEPIATGTAGAGGPGGAGKGSKDRPAGTASPSAEPSTAAALGGRVPLPNPSASPSVPADNGLGTTLGGVVGGLTGGGTGGSMGGSTPGGSSGSGGTAGDPAPLPSLGELAQGTVDLTDPVVAVPSALP